MDIKRMSSERLLKLSNQIFFEQNRRKKKHPAELIKKVKERLCNKVIPKLEELRNELHEIRRELEPGIGYMGSVGVGSPSHTMTYLLDCIVSESELINKGIG